MEINTEEIVRQLTIMKNNSSEEKWEETRSSLNNEAGNPCCTVGAACEGIYCSKCIFDTDPHRNHITQTIKILEDNPHIIPTVELLC
jgi:hypothetical protein